MSPYKQALSDSGKDKLSLTGRKLRHKQAQGGGAICGDQLGWGRQDRLSLWKRDKD